MSGTISDSIWSSIVNSVNTDNLTEIIKIYNENKLDYSDKGGDWESTVLHYAASQDIHNIAKHVVEGRAELESRNRWGHTPLSVAAGNDSVEVARVLLQQGANIESRTDRGRTPLSWAAANDSVEVARLLVQHGADITTQDNAGISALYYMQQDMSTEDKQAVFRVLSNDITLANPAVIIQDLEVREEYDDDVKVKLNNLLGRAIDKLAGVIDDPKQRFQFYKGTLYIGLVTVFLDRGGEDVILLRTIYIALQAKDKCDQPKKVMLKKELNTDIYTRFQTRIKDLASNLVLKRESSDINVIAGQIDKEYLREKKPSFLKSSVQRIKSCCCPAASSEASDNRNTLFSTVKSYCSTAWGTMKDKLKSCCQCMKCCPSIPTELYHNCSVLGKMATLMCTLGIIFYLLDLYTDLVVGIEDFSGFSQKLGLFEIILVVFTLCHENFRSSDSAYTTKEELLRIEFGRFDITAEHWGQSNLNWSKNRPIRWLYKLFCPFKVSGRPGKVNKLKAILFNILTCLQLRPVVDRLVVLLHAPTSLREYYRRQAEQNCLKQFYLILEQLPELLVQFYTFLIVFNNLTVSEIQDYIEATKNNSDTCYHYFNYSRLNTNNTNDTNLFCNNLSLSEGGLKTCGTVFRLISMAIPFYNIPSGIASLEDGFRKLDPLTPKMSTALKVIFQVSYMMMIPARLFMFAAVMHAVYTKEYVFGFIIFRVILELLTNLYSLRAHFTKSFSKMASTLWRLCLFSIRDVFLISIRDPSAYLSKPSDVSYNSLRKRTNLAVRAVPFLYEGLIAALIIEQRYPCGKHSDYFKYLGWFCIIPLVLSISMIVMVSDLFHPINVHSSSLINNTRKFLITGFTNILIMGGVALTFSLSQKRGLVELLIMGVATFLHIVLIAGLSLYIKMSSKVKETGKDPEKVKTSVEVSEGAGKDDISKLEKNKDDISELGEETLLLSEPTENINSEENNEPGFPELDGRTVINESSNITTAEHTVLDVLEDVRSEENDELDIGKVKDTTPLSNESSSPIRGIKPVKVKISSEKFGETPSLDETSNTTAEHIEMGVMGEVSSDEIRELGVTAPELDGRAPLIEESSNTAVEDTVLDVLEEVIFEENDEPEVPELKDCPVLLDELSSNETDELGADIGENTPLLVEPSDATVERIELDVIGEISSDETDELSADIGENTPLLDEPSSSAQDDSPGALKGTSSKENVATSTRKDTMC